MNYQIDEDYLKKYGNGLKLESLEPIRQIIIDPKTVELKDMLTGLRYDDIAYILKKGAKIYD